MAPHLHEKDLNILMWKKSTTLAALTNGQIHANYRRQSYVINLK